MSLPPLPKPPSDVMTTEVEITLPKDLFDDLSTAAAEQKMDVPTAVVQCIHLWRYPPAPAAAPQRRARKGVRS